MSYISFSFVQLQKGYWTKFCTIWETSYKEGKESDIELNWIFQNDAEMSNYSLLVGYRSVAIEGGL